MSSAVEICNQALAQLGAGRILSLVDDTTEAQLCNTFYEPVRDALVEAHEWSFARARVRLVPITTPPVSYWDAAYELPSDVLRVLNVSQDPNSRADAPEWDREGSTIVIKTHRASTAIYVRYLKRITDPNRFGPVFVQALVVRIAAEMAMPLRESRALQQQMWSLYNAKVSEAMTADGMQGRSQRMDVTTLTRVRGRGGQGVFDGPFMFFP